MGQKEGIPLSTNTYIALDKVTVGTATPSITFTGISGSYTDLVIVANFTVASVSANLQMYFNGDNSSGLYSKTQLEGTGTSALSGNTTGGNAIGLDSNIGDDTTSPSIQIVQLMNYANTSVFKTALVRQAGFWSANPGTSARVGLWRNANAITSVTFTNGAVNFAVGSTFSLYGIAASSVAAKATGGTIYSDSQYFYHVFDASGTFTPTQSISADCLVVAGGGGGGNTGNVTGGGGAGGLLGFTSQSLTATGYTVTVGAGGAAQTNGVDSQFGALTLVKGGGYGAKGGAGGENGATGGSGGGAATSGTAGSATSGQGFAGGTGTGTQSGGSGGGGGGAGAVGSNGTSGSAPGNGGVGSSTYSSWGVVTGIGQNVNGTYYLAGGGGGGSYTGSTYPTGNGGYGGGGGIAPSTYTTGTANTGGGGSTGRAGGSGVVIVRYAK